MIFLNPQISSQFATFAAVFPRGKRSHQRSLVILNANWRDVNWGNLHREVQGYTLVSKAEDIMQLGGCDAFALNGIGIVQAAFPRSYNDKIKSSFKSQIEEVSSASKDCIVVYYRLDGYKEHMAKAIGPRKAQSKFGDLGNVYEHPIHNTPYGKGGIRFFRVKT